MRAVIRWLKRCFGICSKCGAKYAVQYQPCAATFGLTNDLGRGCPYGHEGYVDMFYGFGIARMHYGDGDQA
jgi:hypothetical protein